MKAARLSCRLSAGHSGGHVAPEAAFRGGFGWPVQIMRSARMKLVAEHQQDGGRKEYRRYQNGESRLHIVSVNPELGVFQSLRVPQPNWRAIPLGRSRPIGRVRKLHLGLRDLGQGWAVFGVKQPMGAGEFYAGTSDDFPIGAIRFNRGRALRAFCLHGPKIPGNRRRDQAAFIGSDG
jgi:hypothetical protein